MNNQNLIDQYKKLHQDLPGYGAGAAYGTKILELITENNFKTILDFGCGKGELAKFLNRKSKEKNADYYCSAYDPAIPAFDRIHSNHFDLVIANDVFEHFHPVTYISDIERVASLASRGIFLNISCRPAVHLLPNGENCHTCLMTPNEWIRTLVHEDSIECNESHFDGLFKGFTLMELKYHPKNKNLVLFFLKL